MTLSRSQLAFYLGQQFSTLATLIEQAATDDSDDGYGPDIDNALRKLGTDESDLPTATVADGDRAKALALVEYYAARRFWRLLGSRFKFQADGVSVDYGDMRKNVQAMMDDAAEECAALGVSVTTGGFEMIRLNLDYIEPEPTS